MSDTARAQTRIGIEGPTDGRWADLLQPTIVARDVEISYLVRHERGADVGFLGSRFAPRRREVVEAVRGVDLVTLPGEVVALVGSNGSGKSTLLRGLAGLMPLTRGRVLASHDPVLMGVAAALVGGVSARRNVLLGCTALGLTLEEAAALLPEIVAFAGVEDAMDRPLDTFSSGMRARLQFAISTATRPRILLIDETLAVGDHSFQRRSKRRIRELADEAGTVVIVSHSTGILREICSRAVWLDRGVVRADGLVGEVLTRYEAAT